VITPRITHLVRVPDLQGMQAYLARCLDPSDARSVAIIVRSQKLGQGTVLQGRYDPKTNVRTEGYGPTQVPYELVG